MANAQRPSQHPTHITCPRRQIWQPSDPAHTIDNFRNRNFVKYNLDFRLKSHCPDLDYAARIDSFREIEGVVSLGVLLLGLPR